ncbi:hypothetical protein JZ751_009867 [Albula glossodonta]|uniref:Uncharacterized protein n=1 Tax=Albula glossodonta TaxID=121402 RepID=A0A8T2P1T6_9TELE|nr:hypothetical protein JZ751_009867 [Albula glossodonta]
MRGGTWMVNLSRQQCGIAPQVPEEQHQLLYNPCTVWPWSVKRERNPRRLESAQCQVPQGIFTYPTSERIPQSQKPLSNLRVTSAPCPLHPPPASPAVNRGSERGGCGGCQTVRLAPGHNEKGLRHWPWHGPGMAVRDRLPGHKDGL